MKKHKNIIGSHSNISEKIKELGITENWYNNAREKLEYSGYGYDEIHKLILRKNPMDSVKAVIEVHSKLIKYITRTTIVELGIKNSAHKKLKFTLSIFEEKKDVLERLGKFNIKGESLEELFIKIIGNHGGEKNWKAFSAAIQDEPTIQALNDLGCQGQDLINLLAKIIGNHGGSNNWTAFSAAIQDEASIQILEKLNCKDQKIVNLLEKIMGYHGGSNNWVAFSTAIQDEQLIQAFMDLGYQGDDLARKKWTHC